MSHLSEPDADRLLDGDEPKDIGRCEDCGVAWNQTCVADCHCRWCVKDRIAKAEAAIQQGRDRATSLVAGARKGAA